METARMSPTLWFKVYVALAVSSLCVACLGIWLGSELITAHRKSVHLHGVWGARLADLAELSTHAAAAHGAISGDFDRQHAGRALERMRRAASAFEVDAARWLQDVGAVEDEELSQLLSGQMVRAREALLTMQAEGELYFDSLAEDDIREAGRRLAEINRAYAESREAVESLRPVIRSSLTGMLGAQLRTSERLEWIQYSVAALVCMGVMAAMWYGGQLREAMRRAEREHGAYLEALAEGRDAAEAANRAKSEFLANMSHEIRTPMTAMLGYADLLSDPGQTPDERLHCVQTIRQSGEHLLAVLNDILDLSKIEAGGLALEKRSCGVVQILEEVYSLMQPRAVAQKIELRTEYCFPLPREIQTDPLRLKQIVLNLVSNAIKFTPQGSVTVKVEMCASEEAGGPELLIHVQDTGIGMDSDQVGRLFQPFTQVDGSATRRFSGTGLGLAISKRLSEMMGAAIGVESEPGAGSRFTLRLPLAASEAAHTVESLEAAAAVEPEVAGGPACVTGRVLLAEDGPDNQRLISTFLRRAGAEVEVVGNGREAVDRVLGEARGGAPFDLILMDMQMPELDGYGAVRLLRKQGYDGPVLALTAHAMPGERERCLAAGCDDYLTKPIERAKFLEMCAKWSRQRRAAA